MVQPLKWLLKWLLKLKWLFLAHIKACYDSFDPVFVAPENVRNLTDLNEYRKVRVQESKWKHKLFFIQFVVPVMFFLDFGYVLSQNQYDYLNEPMPELMTHRMFHEMFWQQGDFIMIFAGLCSLVVNWNLWLGDWLDDRYAMYFIWDGSEYRLVAGGKIWNKVISEKIYNFWTKNIRQMKFFIVITYFLAESYFQYFLRRKEFTGIKYHLQCYVFVPMMIWNYCFALMFMFYHFFVISNYIIMKQKHLIAMQLELIDALRDHRKLRRQGFYIIRYRFWEISDKLAYICNEIRGYNRFWSIYVTSQFMCNLALFCYFMYCTIFMDASPMEIIYFVYYMVEFAILIYIVIYRCSLVDQNNDKAYANNMKACILFQLKFNHVHMDVLANIDTIATNRNYTRCCFRLINSYRLDSTAFNFAMYIVSTFFMMLCRQKMDKAKKIILQMQAESQ